MAEKPQKATYLQLQQLSLENVQEDPDNPREQLKVDERSRLFVSIKNCGILQPIAVTPLRQKDSYLIIDGHRRFDCAKKIGLETVPCCIYPRMDKGELAIRRFELQTNREAWKPIERAEVFSMIMQTHHFNEKELAKHLGISKTLASDSLDLLEQNSKFKDLMDKYGITHAYASEFLRVKKFLRTIENYDSKQIAEILFKKIQFHVIENAKSLRKLKRIFKQGKRNEKHIIAFLKDTDMTIEELENRMGETSLVIAMRNLIEELGKSYSTGHLLSANEFELEQQLRDLLKRTDSYSSSRQNSHETNTSKLSVVA